VITSNLVWMLLHDGPFQWSLFLEISNEDAIGMKNMFIEISPQYDDNNDEKYVDG